MANIFSKQLVNRQPMATKLLSEALLRNKLLPAYLLTGRCLDDKKQIARELSGYLNCANKTNGRFCLTDGQLDKNNFCLNCRWIERDEHPQALLHLNGVQSTSGKVPVEAARALGQQLSRTSQYYRVVVVEEASEEIFHRPAANSLLKTIEEPNPAMLFFFFALSCDTVLTTIVSRCQVIEMINAHTDITDGVWSLANLLSENQTFVEQGVLELKPMLSAMASDALMLEAGMTLAHKLQELMEDKELDFDYVIDAVIALELEQLRLDLARSPNLIDYAQKLLKLGESAKLYNRHYVSGKAAIESLVFSWVSCKLTARNAHN